MTRDFPSCKKFLYMDWIFLRKTTRKKKGVIARNGFADMRDGYAEKDQTDYVRPLNLGKDGF